MLKFCLAAPLLIFMSRQAVLAFSQCNPYIYWVTDQELNFPVDNVLIDNDPCTEPDIIWLSTENTTNPYFILDMGCVDNFNTIEFRQIPYDPIPGKKHGGIGEYKIMVSEDYYDWWVVREGVFPDYNGSQSCTDEKTYTVSIDNLPKRFFRVQSIKNWGDRGGLSLFKVSKV